MNLWPRTLTLRRMRAFRSIRLWRVSSAIAFRPSSLRTLRPGPRSAQSALSTPHRSPGEGQRGAARGSRHAAGVEDVAPAPSQDTNGHTGLREEQGRSITMAIKRMDRLLAAASERGRRLTR